MVQVILESRWVYTCNTNTFTSNGHGVEDVSHTANLDQIPDNKPLPSSLEQQRREPGVVRTHTHESSSVGYTFNDNNKPLPSSLDQQQTRETGVVRNHSHDSGYTFNGEAVRTFPVERKRFTSFVTPKIRKKARPDPWCERWGVVATISEPLEAVRRWVRLDGWCLVIVGDGKKYETGWTKGEGNDVVVVLSPDDQKALNFAFFNAVSNNLGLKNIGYLYAIMHGATVIWDFDNYSMLKFWIPDAAPKDAPSINAAIPSPGVETIHVVEPYQHNFLTYNPYPKLGAPTLPSWPRGLPLSHINLPECFNTSTKVREVSHLSVAVLQSLTDYQPDSDAIYQVTLPKRFSFTRSTETNPLVVPKGVLTPYNARSTLHFETSFWALLLPVTVHDRVSDIWRSYFAQRLFWDVGLQLGFLARPLVVQNRDHCSRFDDLDAERDLYEKGEHLVEFLGRWEGKGKTLVERVEELWVALYEHQYIELEDIFLLQQWLQILVDIGYNFPDLSGTPSSWSSLVTPHNTAKCKADDVEDVNVCETATSLTFWTSDVHDGTRIDLPTALASMGHKVILAGSKRWKTPYPFVMNMTGINVYENISPVTVRLSSRNAPLTEAMTIENFEFYKNDNQIASTDAFMCMFYGSMCEMWMPFNKTIIVAPAHRYNLGRCTPEQWGRLTEHFQTLASMDNPKHILAAESVYDQEYLRHYTGIDPLPLYSFSGFYTANNTYAPKRSEILAFGTWDYRLQRVKKVRIRNVRSIYPKYHLSDITNHRAVVYIPYAVMSYKLTELYSLCVPMFMPSMKFIRNIGRTVQHDRSSLGFWYCHNQDLNEQMKAHPNSPHPYSPNIDMPQDSEAEFYWLQFADFFQWPHVTYFDDFQDLERKLLEADFDRIHSLMVEEVAMKRRKLLLNLCKASKKIQSGRIVPQDYKYAIQQLYGVSRLQVT